MNVTVYTLEAVKTGVCGIESSMENPSLRVSGHVSSMNRAFIVDDFAEDEFGQRAEDWRARLTLLMKDHVSGHGTTLSVPGSPDHSRAAR